jgi:hypothetical protein
MVIGRAFVDIAHGGGGIGEEVDDDLVLGLAELVGGGVRLAEDDYWEVVFAVDLVLLSKNIIDLLARAFEQYRLNLGVELLLGEGFGDIGVDAGLEGVQYVFFGGARGEEQDGKGFVVGGLANLHHQLDAVPNGHIPVGEHDVDVELRQPLPAFGSVFGLDHICKTHAQEHSGGEFAHALRVFDQ